jgi:hypothetical protein
MQYCVVMRVTYGIYVEHSDIRRSHEEVLNERSDHMPWLELNHTYAKRSPMNKIKLCKEVGWALTKMTDAMMYSPSVAKSERTMLRKIELVKISLTESGFPPLFSIFWIPFTARKNAAN